MDKLRKAGLYMSALVPINGPLVERYNRCLMMLGIKPTKHSAIHIDALGWSPEVADEKGDNYYLNHGGANPNGIIMSPQQEGKPVYLPFHSFDRALVDLFFANNREAIADITTSSAIIINLDQNIDSFYEPSDLIDYNVVTVGFKVLDGLDFEQKKQRALVAEMYEGNNCLNLNLHSKILASANKFGDLRQRKLLLREVDYQTTSFYTKAFGGVFVLKRRGHKHLMIFESQEEYKKYEHNYDHIHIEDKDLLKVLTQKGYLHFDLEDLDTDRISRISYSIFSQMLKDVDHSFSEIFSTKMLYLKYLNDLSHEDRKNVLGPQKYLDKLKRGVKVEREKYLNDDIFASLHSPAIPELDVLLGLLICRINPTDPYLTYYYDKELFYEEYQKYPPSYQDWVIDMIKRNIS